MGKLILKYDNLPKGAEVEIPPFGLFHNGESVEVEGLEEDLTLPPDPVETLVTSHTKEELERMATDQGVQIRSGMTKREIAESLLAPQPTVIEPGDVPGAGELNTEAAVADALPGKTFGPAGRITDLPTEETIAPVVIEGSD